MIKKIVEISLLSLGVFILLYLLITDYFALEEAKYQVSENMNILSIRMTLWAFILGIIFEWRKIKRVWDKKVSFNLPLFIGVVVLAGLIFIPNSYWLNWYSSPSPNVLDLFFNMLLIDETHLIISTLCGALLIRSLTFNE